MRDRVWSTGHLLLSKSEIIGQIAKSTSHVGDGIHMATMHTPHPPHLNETKFFLALGYTEHEIKF